MSEALDKVRGVRELPIFPLPVVLFPGMPMPLHIFEPRYRAMLAWALERNRMFCVALMKSGISEAASTEDFYQTAGLGLVRACVQRPDGTFNLVLQGLTRVQFAGFIEEEPFRIAHLRELPSRAAPQVQAEALATKLLELCGELRSHCSGIPEKLGEQLAKMTDPEMLGDVIAHTFLQDAYRRQQLLEEAEVSERLRALLRHLREQLG